MQAETWDPKRIDQELGWAEGLGARFWHPPHNNTQSTDYPFQMSTPLRKHHDFNPAVEDAPSRFQA